jgi:hypothetical protein
MTADAALHAGCGKDLHGRLLISENRLLRKAFDTDDTDKGYEEKR